MWRLLIKALRVLLMVLALGVVVFVIAMLISPAIAAVLIVGLLVALPFAIPLSALFYWRDRAMAPPAAQPQDSSQSDPVGAAWRNISFDLQRTLFLVVVHLIFNAMGAGIVYGMLHTAEMGVVMGVVWWFYLAFGVAMLTLSLSSLVIVVRRRVRYNAFGIRFNIEPIPFWKKRFWRLDWSERFLRWEDVVRVERKDYRKGAIVAGIEFQDGSVVALHANATIADEAVRLAQQALDENRRRGD